MKKRNINLIELDPLLHEFHYQIEQLDIQFQEKKTELLQKKRKIKSWALGHLYYGVHFKQKGVVIREFAPLADEIFLVGDFNQWKKQEEYAFKKLENGNWELILSTEKISHLDYYQLLLVVNGQELFRIPRYANYVVQDQTTFKYCSRIWHPAKKFKFKHKSPGVAFPLLIYEAHIGMASSSEKVATYLEFRDEVLPRIVDAGYTTIQLMGIAEHPYYASFGYQVTNFFAPSSRFGTPDELKMLIDAIHEKGLTVIIDLVHSHAAINEGEGLNNFDGDPGGYFHIGPRGLHPAWKTRCFNYANHNTLHFLLSNINYWISEFKFDGIRFDGVTSILFKDHGLGRSFANYSDYYGDNLDEDAVTYFKLANQLLGELLEVPISIAEDVSGFPGLAYPVTYQGLGFSHRLAMGVADFWVNQIEQTDIQRWNMDQMWFELTNIREAEGAISYCESHDQALVGDKTIIFRLADSQMYEHFHCRNTTLLVEEAIELHKLIRAITLLTAQDGYLNFMGNEFGHPEWIDFPREENNNSFKYAKRQWELVDNKELCYAKLAEFERQLLNLVKEYNLFTVTAEKLYVHNDNQILIFQRGPCTVCFNFNRSVDFAHYYLGGSSFQGSLIFSSVEKQFGRLDGLSANVKREITLDESLFLPHLSMLIYLQS